MNSDGMNAKKCIHCGKCTRSCPFLSKYQIDIGATEKLSELAYHCFLCGRCSEVCPMGIDGRGLILKMRQEQVKKSGEIPEKGYGMLLLEKKNYLLRNYRNVDVIHKKNNESMKTDVNRGKKSVFFPGCNFPSFYPETNKKIISLFQEYGIGVVFDCCGKPMAELGLKETEETIVAGIEKRIKEKSVTEVIMACSNCYSFLKGRLKEIRVISIYEKLNELGIGEEIEKDINIFLPCPDRKEKELLGQMQSFLAGEVTIITEASCCGLGGCAADKEPELSKGMAESIRKAGYEEVYTYCASCSGNLTRNGCEKVMHVLSEILETNEKPDTKGSFLNRIKTKFV